MTIIEEIITVILFAKMLVLNGKWSAIVSVSEVSAQISFDLLLFDDDSFTVYSD